MSAPQNITINGVRCVRARLLLPWRGAWILDLDVDPDGAVSASSVPSGAATVTIGDSITLKGTVDPKAAGRWASGVQLRVVAGGGGWDQDVAAEDFQNPSGVSSTTVQHATAALVGETVHDPSPISLGLRWERLTGPASLIFTNPDRDWYVDTAGVTQVGTWPVASPDATVEVLEFDPLQQRATLSADALILPGTVLSDTSSTPRFDGKLTARDVEMVWDPKGTRATVWFSATQVTRLVSALTNAIRVLGGLGALKSYAYTIVSQTGALLTLQAQPFPDGTKSKAPDLVKVSVWPGMSGLSAQHKLGSACRVVFLEAGFAAPIVVSFDGTNLPDGLTLDTTGTAKLGPSASGVELAGGGPGIARQGDTVLAYLPNPCPITGTLGGTPFVGLLEVPGPMVGAIQTSSSKGKCG